MAYLAYPKNKQIIKMKKLRSDQYVDERAKVPFLRRLCNHNLGSSPIFGTHLVSSLDKALYNDYLCLVA